MKPHKHAAIIMAYAERAQVSETPWDILEYRSSDAGNWMRHPGEPTFCNSVEYRIKPKTININGIEVPEPYRGVMELGQIYYVPNVTNDRYSSTINWGGDVFDIRVMNSGMVHLDRDSAIIHAKALLSFTEK